MRSHPKGRGYRFDSATTEDMEYTEEELAFFRAMDKFQTDTHTRFPTLRETLRVLKSLGYAKVTPT